jgi:hypothetical protein
MSASLCPGACFDYALLHLRPLCFDLTSTQETKTMSRSLSQVPYQTNSKAAPPTTLVTMAIHFFTSQLLPNSMASTIPGKVAPA